MCESLDRFLPPSVVKKQDSVAAEDRCSNPKCKRKIPINEPKYTLRIRGTAGVYCQECAKKILRPQEDQDEPCINSLTVFRTETKWTDEEGAE